MKTKKVKSIQDILLTDNDFLSYINPYNNKNVSMKKKLDTIPSFITKKNKINKISIKIKKTDINTIVSSILSPDSKNKKKKIKNNGLNQLTQALSLPKLKVLKNYSINKKPLNLIPLALQKNKSSFKLNFFKDFEKSFYFNNDFSHLRYNASEIFKGKSVYDKLIIDKINYLKKGDFDTKTVKLEKIIHYGIHKKELKLSLNSLTISLEEMALSPEKQNKNLNLTLPMSLLPLFYYKGINVFQKIIAAAVKPEDNFKKISFDINAIQIALNNIPDFKTDINEENIKDNFDENLVDKKEIKNIKNECLRPMILKRNLNFLNFNYFIFFWVTNTRNFSTKITLPCIYLDILDNHISMKLFIDYELLFFLYDRNFVDWEFYIIKYLSTFSKYRSIFEHLGSHSNINNSTFFLKEPKTKINSFSQDTLFNIYTDPFNDNQIIWINSFYVNAQLIDESYSLENNYKILFSFFQYVKLYEIAKYSNKIEFLSKFIEIDTETHSLNFNFKKYDEFDVNSWMKNIKKFSGSSLKLNNNNINEDVSSEFNIYNKKLKIEYKKPLWNIIKFENKKEIIKTFQVGNEMEFYFIESIINPSLESWTKFLILCLEKIKETYSVLPKISSKKKMNKNNH